MREYALQNVLSDPGEIARFHIHLRMTEFGGSRPYPFLDERQSESGRWEMWMDAGQAGVVRAEAAAAGPGPAENSPRNAEAPGRRRGLQLREEELMRP